MGHKSKHHIKKKKSASHAKPNPTENNLSKPLEIVIKGDTDGCEEAVCQTIESRVSQGVPIEIIHKGVGDICKNDILTASTGSKLVVGFNVNVLPKISELCLEQGVEVRLYSVIYKLQEDLREISQTLIPKEPEEHILGSAHVIALFKSSRKGIILGCEVNSGRLQLGDKFRVISGMGPVYSGSIESLHIEKNNVKKATQGQQVGLKITNFNKAKIGDIVESYEITRPAHQSPWQPSGKILHL
ncbi:MAG: hypothetical protein KQH63_08110 [Desulfobulbaceae bacterium]|nr:hypothetical protein [Desulfobulbaceae bacterium]